jgi:D-aminopeptidase
MQARELGIRVGTGEPGPADAITDVAGLRVGHTTLVEGCDVRTGVTVILPHEGDPGSDPVYAGCHRLNGNGELTGLEWIRESGLLTTPIAITNTHSVGVVRDALIAAGLGQGLEADQAWSLPVVGETWDGTLNDTDGFHVRPEHVFAALGSASGGPVAQGNVGGGTGMICHELKGGIGTASRVVETGAGRFVVGVLVQANYGWRRRLSIDGVPVGRELG